MHNLKGFSAWNPLEDWPAAVGFQRVPGRKNSKILQTAGLIFITNNLLAYYMGLWAVFTYLFELSIGHSGENVAPIVRQGTLPKQ